MRDYTRLTASRQKVWPMPRGNRVWATQVPGSRLSGAGRNLKRCGPRFLPSKERRDRNDGTGTTGQERRDRNDGTGINTQGTDLCGGSLVPNAVDPAFAQILTDRLDDWFGDGLPARAGAANSVTFRLRPQTITKIVAFRVAPTLFNSIIRAKWAIDDRVFNRPAKKGGR